MFISFPYTFELLHPMFIKKQQTYKRLISQFLLGMFIWGANYNSSMIASSQHPHMVLSTLLNCSIYFKEDNASRYSQKGVTQETLESFSKSSFSQLREAAVHGDAVAQRELGIMYYYGEGICQDHIQVFQWFSQAVAEGDAIAQYNLGHMYKQGEGTNQDYVAAFRWIQKAAVQGLSDAQNGLGLMYQHAEGVKQDYVEALKWFKQAEAQGKVESKEYIEKLEKPSR